MRNYIIARQFSNVSAIIYGECVKCNIQLLIKTEKGRRTALMNAPGAKTLEGTEGILALVSEVHLGGRLR